MAVVAELALLRSERALEETGLLVTFDSGRRGRLVYALPQLPDGVVCLSPSRAPLQRFGNVVRLASHLVDVPFCERAPVLWEGAGEALPPLSRGLVDRVLALLDERTLLALGRVSKAWRNATTDAVVWMELFARRFGYLPPFSGAARGFWISRFSHQRREVNAFGSVDVAVAPPEERMMRVVLMGPPRAGKTTLLSVLQNSSAAAEATQPSTFVRTSVASGFVGGSSLLCSVKFWDIPGDPRNRSIASVYCSTAHCLVFVYDAAEMSSLAQVKDWVLTVKMSVKSTGKTLAFLARGSAHCVEAREFAKREKLVLLTEDVAQDRGFEWRLFLWRLCSTKKTFL